MKKNYFIILDRASDDPIELRISEDPKLQEKYSIDCEQIAGGLFVALLPSESLLGALDRAIELRRQVIKNGTWDVVCANHENSILKQ